MNCCTYIISKFYCKNYMYWVESLFNRHDI